MERKAKRKPKDLSLEAIRAKEREVAQLRQRADQLEQEAKQDLIELTCGKLADRYGSFNSSAVAAVLSGSEQTDHETKTDYPSCGE